LTSGHLQRDSIPGFYLGPASIRFAIDPESKRQRGNLQGFNILPSVVKSDLLLRDNIDISTKAANEDEKDKLLWDQLEKHRDEKLLVYIDRKREEIR
jgi:hypothetical protein